MYIEENIFSYKIFSWLIHFITQLKNILYHKYTFKMRSYSFKRLIDDTSRKLSEKPFFLGML